MKCYLRMEGVNLMATVYDTAKIQSIRGASAILLDAPRKVMEKFSLTPISVGASSGLFEADAVDLQQLRFDVEKYLGTEAFQYFTWVVDCTPANVGFETGREKLIAANRWRQMQSLCTDLPPILASNFRVCDWDGIRPVSRDAMSAATLAKQEHGSQPARTRFYREQAGRAITEFHEDLNYLTKGQSRTLSNKMALLYLDGNKFGKLQSTFCGTPDEQKAFDGQMRVKRKELFGKVIDEVWSGTGKLPLETLLWGGDEMLWIVPANLGLRVLRDFFKLTGGWNFPGRDDIPMTHAAGLVFCNRKAPIARVRALAKHLCDKAKETLDRDATRQENVFMYAVLESYDFIGGELEEHFKSRCPQGADPAEHVLKAACLDDVKTLKRDIGEFPMGKLHASVRELLAGRDAGDAIADVQATAKKGVLEKTFGNTNMRFVHLLELWNYLEGAE